MDEFARALAESEGPRTFKRPDGSNFPSLDVMAMTQFPEFFEHPMRNIRQIKIEHDLVQDDTVKMWQTIESVKQRIEALRKANLRVPPSFVRHCNLAQAAYGLLLALHISFGAIIAAYEQNDDHMQEPFESLIEKVLALAEASSPNRPLGTSFISLPLAAASAACKNVQQRDQIDEMIDAQMTDFSERVSENDAAKLRKLLDKISKVQNVRKAARVGKHPIPVQVRLQAKAQ